MSAAEHIGRADGTVSAQTTHQLYQRYGRQIYAYCLHHLRSREEAEDAVQTTFLNAFRGLQSGTVAHSEQAWLYKIAQNVCLARHSSRARRLRLETPNNFEVLQETVASPQADGADELIGIEDALEGMPENQRRAILLREWQGLSYREIAEELQLSQSAVEMLIFRARRALANALEQPEAKTAKRRIVSLGSLLAGLKSLLSGGAAVKAVALAFAAGSIVVAGEAEHTIVNRPAKRVEPAASSASAAAAVVPAAARSQAGRAAGLPVSGAAVDPRAPGHAGPLAVLTAHAGYRAGWHGPSPTIAPDPAAPAPSAPAPAPPQPQPQSAAPAPAPPPPVQSAPAPQPAPPSPPKSDPAPQPTTPPSSGDAGKDKGKNANDGRASASAAPAPAPAPAPTPTTTVAAAAVQPAPAAAQPVPAATGDQGNGNGNGKRGDHVPAQAPPVPVQPAPAAAQPVPAATGDQGNGHGNGKKGGDNAPAQTQPAPVAAPPTTTTTPVAPTQTTTTTSTTTVTTTTTQAPTPPPPPVPLPAAPTPPSGASGNQGNGHGNGNANGNGKGHGKDH